jgi:hypothetical protein
MAKQCGKCGAPLTESIRFCPNCGAEASSLEERSQKPGSGRGFRISYFIYGLVVIVLAVGIVTYVGEAFRTYHPVIERQPVVAQPSRSGEEKIASTMIASRVEGPFIIVSLKEIKEKRIVRFVDPDGIQNIPILAYITPSGKLVTAMSISESCRSRDFFLQGENIHCASCPSYWNASSLEAYACCQKYYPEPIQSSVLGDEVRVDKELIRKWQARS